MISGFLGPPSPSGQRLYGFNRGRSLVVTSRVKSLETPAMSEWDCGKLVFLVLVLIGQDSPNF